MCYLFAKGFQAWNMVQWCPKRHGKFFSKARRSRRRLLPHKCAINSLFPSFFFVFMFEQEMLASFFDTTQITNFRIAG